MSEEQRQAPQTRQYPVSLPPEEQRSAYGIVNWILLLAFVYVASSAIYGVAERRGWVGNSPASLQGQAAPSFRLDVHGKSGEQAGLEDYRGRYVLLDFWATWCPPCHKQMAAMKRMKARGEIPEQLVVLAMNTDKSEPMRRAKVRSYVSRSGTPFTVLLDEPGLPTKRAYNVEAIPTMVLIDPQGKLLYASSGLHEEEELREIFAEYVK